MTRSARVVVVSERLGALTVHEQRLTTLGVEVRSAPLWSADQILSHASDADVVVLGAVEPFDRDVLAGLPKLAAVVRRGVGFDNVDVAAATSLGILVANVPDASVEEVSDHALALLLALERRLTDLDRGVRSGRWNAEPAALHEARVACRRLSDLTLGIVGLGRIGTAMARKARSVYSEIVAFDPALSPDIARQRGVISVGFQDLLSRADHVSLHLPMTSDNRYLVGEEELAQMRRGAVLVNAARGGLVDEAALARALRAGHLSGAGLDVTETEPLPSDSPLLDIGEPLVLTAHSAAWSSTATTNLAAGSVDAAIAVLDGRLPVSVVNSDVLVEPALRVKELRSASS